MQLKEFLRRRTDGHRLHVWVAEIQEEWNSAAAYNHGDVGTAFSKANVCRPADNGACREQAQQRAPGVVDDDNCRRMERRRGVGMDLLPSKICYECLCIDGLLLLNAKAQRVKASSGTSVALARVYYVGGLELTLTASGV